jgi:3'-phosphoadenosine 5'-phosphosulfate sulfotransferase (PAPS reductase)/FAD synthetase
MEWNGTLELVKTQADHYGLRVEVSKYRDKHAQEKDLLVYVRLRRKWPDAKNRFCTSEFKRGPGGRVVVKLFRESAGPVLNVYGFRADESSARAKKKVFVRNSRFSCRQREVWDWLPIHDWSSGDVWESIRESRVPHHPAYDLGMSRLSCRFCIFAPRDSLLLSGRANPELLDEYCELETEIGHAFQNGRSINSIRDAIRAGEMPSSVTEAWRM